MKQNTKADLHSAGSGTVVFFIVVVPIGLLIAIVAAICVVSMGAP